MRLAMDSRLVEPDNTTSKGADLDKFRFTVHFLPGPVF